MLSVDVVAIAPFVKVNAAPRVSSALVPVIVSEAVVRVKDDPGFVTAVIPLPALDLF